MLAQLLWGWLVTQLPSFFIEVRCHKDIKACQKMHFLGDTLVLIKNLLTSWLKFVHCYTKNMTITTSNAFCQSFLWTHFPMFFARSALNLWWKKNFVVSFFSIIQIFKGSKKQQLIKWRNASSMFHWFYMKYFEKIKWYNLDKIDKT